MQIRPATTDDIPAIVGLLKLSLGESLMPKSEQYWRWKHVLNPFGESPVLTCWEGETLIGVRAFMRWQWSMKEKIYTALRAVDTATHPEHQGKGIFKKLTLSLVDECKKNGDQFIFNTPNSQSKPGYLKMGWQEAGKLPIVMSLQRPLSMMKNIFSQGTYNFSPGSFDSLAHYLNHPQLPGLIAEYNQRTAGGTLISVPYLRWRYLDVPVVNYFAIGDDDSGDLQGLIIGRIKPSRVGIELRITDFFLKKKTPADRLVKLLREFKKQHGIDYCTVSGLVPRGQRIIAGNLRWTARVRFLRSLYVPWRS